MTNLVSCALEVYLLTYYYYDYDDDYDYYYYFVSDIAIFVLKRDVKLQLTN